MTNIIETKFGTLVNTSKIAAGSASSIKKSGAFYNFSIRISNDDIREYSLLTAHGLYIWEELWLVTLKKKLKKKVRAFNLVSYLKTE